MLTCCLGGGIDMRCAGCKAPRHETPLLPTRDWRSEPVGLDVSRCPRDPDTLRANFGSRER